MQVLRIKAVPGRLCADPVALEAGSRIPLGRRRASKPTGSKADDIWPIVPEGVEVPDKAPWRMHVRDALKKGDLEPADAETAALVGVPWKSAFVPKKGEK